MMEVIVCKQCGHWAPKVEYLYGKGRAYGQHPDHRYCPACGISIDWAGYETLHIQVKPWPNVAA